MRSDNMPRPFAPEHGEEAESQLQRDIERVERMMECALPDGWEAWQRLKPRLTPDRERVARAIAGSLGGNPRVGELPPSWMKAADAAIDAMKETP